MMNIWILIVLNACIAIPDEGSVIFHKKMGYLEVAHFHQCGYKFNRWYDMVWMEKFIGEHLENQLPIIEFNKIKDQIDLNEE